jgi:hypothetical protein
MQETGGKKETQCTEGHTMGATIVQGVAEGKLMKCHSQ